MRKLFLIVMIAVMAAACSKDDGPVPVSGTVTLSSKSVEGGGTFYVLGYTFSTASFTRSTSNPGPDVALLHTTGAAGAYSGSYFAAVTFLPSFRLYGEYAGANEAETAFDALTEVPGGESWGETGDGLAINQIWIVRTAEEKYAKIRIISLEVPSAVSPVNSECRFEWVFQPDGTSTFPQ
jgi:hypothetical protein